MLSYGDIHLSGEFVLVTGRAPTLKLADDLRIGQ